ncbi:AraC family transcriptional regulator ligand-binding domain-containing protein [Streptomyces sp. NPDC054932]
MRSPGIDGTVSAHLARCLVNAATGAGVRKLSRLSDLSAEVLGNDLARISTSSLVAVWEHLVLTEHGTLIGAELLEHAPAGTFGLWDYLITSGPTLRESLRQAVELIAVIGDPDQEKLIVVDEGPHLTVRHATGSWGPDVVEAVDIFALFLFLTRARAATGSHIVPSRVTITHRPPARIRRLTELFGTTRVHFDAPYNSISFAQDDVRTPLPKAQPGMERVLARHAELTLASSQPVLQWHDRFRMVLAGAFRADTVTLEHVAEQLAMSSRTLQRRLAEHGTTWRAQVEAVRQEHTLELLHTTDLPLRSIADRVGYSDVRALRRAVHRWEGQAPRDVRKAPERTSTAV